MVESNYGRSLAKEDSRLGMKNWFLVDQQIMEERSFVE